MSPRGSKGPEPEPDIYVGLLFVSVAALIAGCLFLTVELHHYGWSLFAG